MKKIEFAVPELRKIEINGLVFDILKSDADVMMKAAELRNEYAHLTKIKSAKASDFDAIVKAVKAIISYVDEILGEGATKKIVNGKPLGIVQAVTLMTTICAAVVEEYNDDVADKYGDDETPEDDE